MLKMNHNLPISWVWTRLEEISEIILGQSPPSSTYNENRNGLPFYQGKLEFGDIYPTPQKWCSAPKKIAEKGDVLISVRAPVGPTNICPEKSCIGRGLAAIRPLGGIETLFTLYLMRAFKNSIAEKGTGTTFDAITGIQLKEFDILLPPFPEQRAIVSKIEQLFSDLDNGIKNFKKAQAQLKLHRQSVLKAACEGKLVPTEAELARAEGRDYEAADVLLARILMERREKSGKGGKYKEPMAPDMSKMLKLPEGWGYIQLELSSNLITKGESPNWQGFDYVDEGIPFIRSENVLWGNINLSSYVKIPEEFHEKLRRSHVKPNDVLINLVGASIGRCGIVPLSIKDANINQAVALIRLNNNLIPAYLLNLLLSPQLQKKIHGSKVETARPNINLEDLRQLVIPLPPLAEQRRIVAEVERRLSVSDKLEATIKESLQKAESLRQSILKKAFEGKLLNKKELEKAQNASDWEPADKLLERIKAEKKNLRTKE